MSDKSTLVGQIQIAQNLTGDQTPTVSHDSSSQTEIGLEYTARQANPKTRAPEAQPQTREPAKVLPSIYQ